MRRKDGRSPAPARHQAACRSRSSLSGKAVRIRDIAGLPRPVRVMTVILVALALYGGYIRLWFAKHGVPGHLF